MRAVGAEGGSQLGEGCGSGEGGSQLGEGCGSGGG